MVSQKEHYQSDHFLWSPNSKQTNTKPRDACHSQHCEFSNRSSESNQKLNCLFSIRPPSEMNRHSFKKTYQHFREKFCPNVDYHILLINAAPLDVGINVFFCQYNLGSIPNLATRTLFGAFSNLNALSWKTTNDNQLHPKNKKEACVSTTNTITTCQGP